MTRTTIIVLCGAAACSSQAATDPCPSELRAGDLVISEVFADRAAAPGASGADDGHEWIELYDASPRAAALAGVVVTLAHADGSAPKTFTIPGGVVDSGAYVVLGDADPAGPLPAWVDAGYGRALGAISNSGGRLSLACGGEEIDAVTFGASKAGRSLQLDGSAAPAAVASADPDRWCAADPAATTEFEPMNFGTPGAPNPACVAAPPPGSCDDGGVIRAIETPAAGQLAIAEWMADPTAVADGAGEWIEIVALADVDLDGVQLGGAALVATPVVAGPACAHVTAGTRVLFARSDDPAQNGGLPAVAGRFSFALDNAHGAIQLGAGGAVIDQVAWDKATPGVSIQRDGGAQCDAPAGTPAYDGTDVGTPGAAPAVACQ
jgi:hypothetical protein